MKKIELNNMGRKVLVVLTWLITLSVVATLGISGSGFFGSLTFYAGILFLAFVYFNDEKLQKTVKKSLIVAFIFVLVFFAIETYSSILNIFAVTSRNAYRVAEILSLVAKFAKYTIVGIFVLAELFDFGGCKDSKEAIENKEQSSNEEESEEKAQ